MKKAELIAALQLQPHIEGGFFRRTFASPQHTGTTSAPRPLMSTIYYMLTDDSPTGRMHRNRSDIMHYWHAGSALRYWLLSPDGELHIATLGPNLAAGEQLQLLVPGGWWKATELVQGEFGLLSEAVSPGFDFADMALAQFAEIAATYPQYASSLRKFCEQPSG